MLTLAALITLACGFWAMCEIACDMKTDRERSRVPTPCARAGDLFWLLVGLCIAATAAHSLAASWF